MDPSSAEAGLATDLQECVEPGGEQLQLAHVRIDTEGAGQRRAEADVEHDGLRGGTAAVAEI